MRLSWYLSAVLVTALTAPAALTARAQSAPTLAPQTKIKVQLKTRLDTKKSKVGDKVEAQVKQDIKNGETVVLPKNSYLVGTVTEVDASDHGSPGKIAVLFQQATGKQGAVLLHLRAAIMKVLVDENLNYGQLSVPTEMGGTGAPVAMDMQSNVANGWDHSSDGKPISYALMQSFNGQGTDLGGVVQSPKSNFHLDSGTEMEVEVLGN